MSKAFLLEFLLMGFSREKQEKSNFEDFQDKPMTCDQGMTDRRSFDREVIADLCLKERSQGDRDREN